MNFEKKQFEAQLPVFVRSLLESLLKEGYVPTLVGGAVRDFFLKGTLGHDWDFELTHPTLSFERGAWKDLGRSFSKFGKVTFLPYEVIRLEAPSFQLEFSPPRIEHFKDHALGHSNFKAEFDFKLPFSKAVKRRDFTINAMGIRFTSQKEIEFLDPTSGLFHLREKLLHYAGEDFEKDPVRFLRAHRFANTMKFSFTPELKKILDHMSLQGVTPAYVWSEMKKAADPVNYISYLVQEKNQQLHVPLEKNFTQNVPEIKKVLKEPRKFETWIISLEWVGIPSQPWSKYFSFSPDTSRRLARWANSSRDFQRIRPEQFQGEFEDLRNTSDFEKLFDWYFTTKQLLKKNQDLPLLSMIEEFLPEWIYLFRFDSIKDVKHIDPPYRAKYQVWNLCQRL